MSQEMSDRLTALKTAMTVLKQMRCSPFQSEPEFYLKIQDQSTYLLCLLTDEVIALRKKIDKEHP